MWAFCPVHTTFATSMNRFLINPYFEVLRPSKQCLGFTLQTNDRIAFNSLSKMHCKTIFSQPNLQEAAQMFNFTIKSYHLTRTFEVYVDKESYTLTYLFQ